MEHYGNSKVLKLTTTTSNYQFLFAVANSKDHGCQCLFPSFGLLHRSSIEAKTIYEAYVLMGLNALLWPRILSDLRTSGC